jgi:MFS transporter, FSR family, fosmidomycin resistance protein
MTAVAAATSISMNDGKDQLCAVKPLKVRYRSQMLLLTTGHFLSDFYNNFLPGLLPVVMASLGLSLTVSGLLVMVYAFTSSILQPIFGYYVDKSGCTWLLLVTIPMSAIFICISSLAPSPALLFLFIALAGLGSSLFHPLGSSLLGKITPVHQKGLAMAIFIGGGNIGVAIAPAVVIYSVVHYGVYSLIWMILPAIAITAGYYYYGTHRIALATTTRTSGPAGPAWYKSSNILKLNVVMGLRSWSQVAIPTFLPIWVVQQGQAPTLAATMLTVYLSGGAIGSVIGGYIGDRIGRKNCIIWSLATCLPTLYLFLTAGEVTTSTWLLLFFSGGALQSALPASIVWAQEMIPANAAMASGMMLGLSFGLGGLGTAITGALADVIGLQPALIWSLLPLALSVPLTYMIPENKITHLPSSEIKA